MATINDIKAKNTKIFSNLVSQWKTEFGNEWFTKNYCKFFLGFEGDVNDFNSWKNRLSKLSKDLSQEQKQLIALYEELLQAYELALQKKAQWWVAKDVISKQRRFIRLYDKKSAELDAVLAPLQKAKVDGRELLQAIYSKDSVAVKKILYAWKSESYLLQNNFISEFSQVGILLSQTKTKTNEIFPPEELLIPPSETTTVPSSAKPIATTPKTTPTPKPNQKIPFYAGFYFSKYKKQIFLLALCLIFIYLIIGFFNSSSPKNTPLQANVVPKDSAAYKDLVSLSSQCANNRICIDVMLLASYPRAELSVFLAKSRILVTPYPYYDSTSARKLNDQGLLELYVKKDLKQAEIFLKQAKEYNPQDAEIVDNLAYVYFLNKQYFEAQNTSYETISINPTRFSSWINLANIFAEQKLTYKATQALLIAYDLAEKKPTVLSNFINKSTTSNSEYIKKSYQDAASIIQTQ
jgi:tetratricopeptide (TPR) repeat protein